MMLGADRWVGHSLAETAGNCGKLQGKHTWMVGQLPCSFGKCGTIFMICHDELYFVAILLGTMWEYYDQA
jgi:hypothetical protein